MRVVRRIEVDVSSGLGQGEETFRRLDRQRQMQQDVDDCEYRLLRANSQRQRDKNRDCERAFPQQPPEAEADVLNQCFDMTTDAHPCSPRSRMMSIVLDGASEPGVAD